MELIKYNNEFFYTYQRDGNDRNGNSIYIVHIVKEYYPCKNDKEYIYANYNYTIATNQKRRLTKNNELRLQSYNIKADIEHIIERA